MKAVIYPKLAWTGIAKNRRTYVPYLLTCVGMIMMYYILRFLMESEQVAAMKGGRTVQEMLSFGSLVFGIFVVIFLFYTNSFLIRSRKREFGLYNILGMGKWNLARILVWENMMMAVISLAGGLFTGILFSKVAELCIARILMEEAGMGFSVGMDSILGTLKLFAGVFLVILLHALFEVGKSKPIDLLHGTNAGEKPPRANWILALIGAVLLAAAYYLAVRIEEPLGAFMIFFLAVAMVIVATYLLFIAGSVVLCRLLQKNKNYYYKANHFVSVSSMMYRMKRNGAGLASICVLSTIVLVMLSAVVCLYIGNEDSLERRYPRELELYSYTFDEEYQEKIQSAVDEAVKLCGTEQENILNYRYLSFGGYVQEDQVILDEEKVNTLGVFDIANIWELYIVTLDDYNRLMGADETLEAGEVIACCQRGGYSYNTITIEGMEKMKIKKQAEEFINNGDAAATILDSLVLIVPDMKTVDQLYQVQKAVYGQNASSRIWYYGFDVPEEDEIQERIAAEISLRLDGMKQQDENFPYIVRNCRAAERADFYALYSGLFVLGILLGIVFLAATVLIMYYKQVTEGYEDQAKFDIMQKVGMTKKEIRKSIHSQMMTVFLMPLLLAGVHTAFAFPIVEKLLLLFGVMNTSLLIAVTVSCFLVFAVFYTLVYLMTSKAYYRIVA